MTPEEALSVLRKSAGRQIPQKEELCNKVQSVLEELRDVENLKARVANEETRIRQTIDRALNTNR